MEEGRAPERPQHPGTDWARFFLGGLFALGALAAMRVARAILLPIVLAALLSMVLKPVHRAIMRVGVHRVVAALIIFLVIAGIAVPCVVYLADPVRAWVQRLPQSFEQVEDKLQTLLSPLERLRRAAERVGGLTDGGNGNVPQVALADNGVSGAIMVAMQEFLVSAGITLLLVFFMLAYGQVLHENLIRRQKSADVVRAVSQDVSNYLFTITIINVVMGLSVGLALWAVGMPGAALWGVMAALLNYIPYVGAVAGVSAVFFVALLSFDGMGRILLAPTVYFIVTSLEGNLITPMVLGQRFCFNPLVIVVWLFFWGWIWGPVGAIIALPLLMVAKIICESVPSARWVGRVIEL